MTLVVVALSLFSLNLDLEFYISERVGGSSMMMPATLLTDALVMVIMVIVIVIVVFIIIITPAISPDRFSYVLAFPPCDWYLGMKFSSLSVYEGSTCLKKCIE